MMRVTAHVIVGVIVIMRAHVLHGNVKTLRRTR
jgi:hypothetical protein